MNGIEKKGNYPYALGRLAGLVEMCCLDLDRGSDPKKIADELRYKMSQIMAELKNG